MQENELSVNSVDESDCEIVQIEVEVPGGNLYYLKGNKLWLENKTLFFKDPREWNAKHIESWLAWASKIFDILPSPLPNRFPTTGKEIVELSKAEFWVCAGSPYGGNTLAKHLADRLQRYTGISKTSLLNNQEPGTKFYKL